MYQTEIRSTDQACAFLGVHRSTLNKYVKSGWLRKYKRNLRDNGFIPGELDAFRQRMLNGELPPKGEEVAHG